MYFATPLRRAAWALAVCTSGIAMLASSCSDEDPIPLSTGGSGGEGGGGEGATGGEGGSDAGLTIPGLDGPVQVVYDEAGLLHLDCTSDNDCFAALGYFHAANRFFFMDFVRNLVRGKLGSLVNAGDLVLEQDYVNRQFFTNRDGEPLEEVWVKEASPDIQGHMSAYTEGVNAWLADYLAEENGATLTTEYDFAAIEKGNIRLWEPEDSMAVAIFVLNDLSNNSPSELMLGESVPAFDPTVGADLFSPMPVFDAFTIAPEVNALSLTPGAPALPSAMGIPAAVSKRLSPHRALLAEALEKQKRIGSGAQAVRPGEYGSNNWAVGPDRTESGNAILSNDPHLAFFNPSIWFGVELDASSNGSGTYHMAGSTFPGVPVVLVGHNESIGWGVTTAYYDLADVYVEELTPDGSSVVFNGQNVPIIEKTFDFEDSSGPTTIQKTFRWVPHHGPIVSENRADNTAISIRWRGHETGGGDLDAFFGVARATSVDTAREALTSAIASNQNFVIVDTEGNIGWFPYSQVPARPWASAVLAPWLPLPGDGSAEWQGSVPIEDLPQLLNPPSGEIATSNQDLTGATVDGDILNDGPALQAYSKSEGTRQRRILDLLAEGGDAHSVDTMVGMQGDTFSLYGETVVPALLAAAGTTTLTAGEQALVDALTAWQFTCPTGIEGSDPDGTKSTGAAATESIGCSAFHTALFAVVRAALADEIAASGVDFAGSRLPLHLVVRALKDPASITSGDLLWDDISTVGPIETRDDILLRGIADAAEALAMVGPADDWRWGSIHTLTLASIFQSFGIPTYNDGPYAAPGGMYTVNVANPSNIDFEPGRAPDWAFGAGPSVRFVVEATPDGPHMVYQLPGGNDLHRESDFYNNLLPNWLINQPIDFPFGPGAVADPAVELEVLPE